MPGEENIPLGLGVDIFVCVWWYMCLLKGSLLVLALFAFKWDVGVGDAGEEKNWEERFGACKENRRSLAAAKECTVSTGLRLFLVLLVSDVWRGDERPTATTKGTEERTFNRRHLNLL